jgi:hypothetical protein
MGPESLARSVSEGEYQTQPTSGSCVGCRLTAGLEATSNGRPPSLTLRGCDFLGHQRFDSSDQRERAIKNRAIARIYDRALPGASG